MEAVLDPSVLRGEFEQNGYALAKGVFSGEKLSELTAEFDRIVRQLSASGEEINARWSGPEMDRLGAAGTTVFHTHNVQQYSAAWLRALLDERFLDAAGALLGPDIVLHHTKLFQKPSETGAPFPMHQDWTYFPSVNDTMIAAIIHVSPATDEMGCLRVYPETHRLGRIAGTSGGFESELLARYPIEGATPVEAEAGDVLFFSYFLIHGSMPNRSDKVRKTVLVQMHSGDDQIEPGNQHPNERLALRGFNYAMTREAANRLK